MSTGNHGTFTTDEMGMIRLTLRHVALSYVYTYTNATHLIRWIPSVPFVPKPTEVLRMPSEDHHGIFLSVLGISIENHLFARSFSFISCFVSYFLFVSFIITVRDDSLFPSIHLSFLSQLAIQSNAIQEQHRIYSSRTTSTSTTMTTSLHAQAINLARRHSIRNENDLLQQNLFDEDETFSEVTERYCSSLLQKRLPTGFELPAECHRYESFQANLRRRQSNREEEEKAAAVAFQGMNPHEALEALRAREHGRLHEAKIKRRMTTHNPQKPETTWF